MARSAAFHRLVRTFRLARFCEQQRLPTREGLERAAALAAPRQTGAASRRDVLVGATTLAALGTLGLVGPRGRALAAPRPPSDEADGRENERRRRWLIGSDRFR